MPSNDWVDLNFDHQDGSPSKAFLKKFAQSLQPSGMDLRMDENECASMSARPIFLQFFDPAACLLDKFQMPLLITQNSSCSGNLIEHRKNGSTKILQF